MTVYQLQREGFQQVRQYYTFKPHQCKLKPKAPGTTARDKFRCPACAVYYTEMQLEAHRCQGGQPGYPRVQPSKFAVKRIK